MQLKPLPALVIETQNKLVSQEVLVVIFLSLLTLLLLLLLFYHLKEEGVVMTITQ